MAASGKAGLQRRTPHRACLESRVEIDGQLFAAGDAGEFFLEAFALSRIAGFGEAICQLEEAVVLGLLGLQAGLDQVDQDAARCRMTVFS
jgi:hypothetical protein